MIKTWYMSTTHTHTPTLYHMLELLAHVTGIAKAVDGLFGREKHH